MQLLYRLYVSCVDVCNIQVGMAAAPDSDTGNHADIQQALSSSGLSEEDQP